MNLIDDYPLQMSDPTYDLFFTGRDDPRCCVIIGENTKPIYLCFETPDRGTTGSSNIRTMVSAALHLRSTTFFLQVVSNNKDVAAVLEWSPGNHLGKAGQ